MLYTTVKEAALSPSASSDSWTWQAPRSEFDGSKEETDAFMCVAVCFVCLLLLLLLLLSFFWDGKDTTWMRRVDSKRKPRISICLCTPSRRYTQEVGVIKGCGFNDMWMTNSTKIVLMLNYISVSNLGNLHERFPTDQYNSYRSANFIGSCIDHKTFVLNICS